MSPLIDAMQQSKMASNVIFFGADVEDSGVANGMLDVAGVADDHNGDDAGTGMPSLSRAAAVAAGMVKSARCPPTVDAG